MRELEGLGHEEIAAALGLSGGGARQAIYRARQALRDGAGLLLPLPLLRLLFDHGGEAVGAGAGGALAAAGVSAGGAGASGALKLGVVAAVVAGSVGAGVAVQSHGGGSSAARAAPAARRQTADRAAASPTAERIASSAPTTAASPGRRRGDSASGGGSGHASPQPSRPGAARRVSRPIEAHPLPPRRPPHLGGHGGERHAGRHGELPPHEGPRGPGPRRGEDSGPGRADGELEGGNRRGDREDQAHIRGDEAPPPREDPKDAHEPGSAPPPPKGEFGNEDPEGSTEGSAKENRDLGR